MKHPNSFSFKIRPNQRGIGIVELLISMFLSFILMGALIQTLMGSLRIDTMNKDSSRIQENGQNALNLMGRSIRQAGARSNLVLPFTGVAVTGVNSPNATTPDTIAIQFEAQETGDIGCDGVAVAAGTLMTFSFTVNALSNPPTLLCNGNIQAYFVENLQVVYGIDTDSDGSIDSYIDAPTAAQFKQVAAVRASVLVRSPTRTISSEAPQTYQFNNQTYQSSDGYLRRVYSSTFNIRNQTT